MRRKPARIRKVIPDVKYKNVLIARFINYIMLNGKKSVIEKAVYKALDMIKEKIKKDPLEVFNIAVENVTPRIEVRSRRIGGATYQIPVVVSERRGSVLALKWLTVSIRSQTGKSLSEKVFKALMDAYNKTGWAFKKKEDVFRMAEANKAFAHYSW